MSHRGKASGRAVLESWGDIMREGYRWTPRKTCFKISIRSYPLRVAGVEPTNNAAERAIHPGVLWCKGSFGTQSAQGSRFVEAVHSSRVTPRPKKTSPSQPNLYHLNG